MASGQTKKWTASNLYSAPDPARANVRSNNNSGRARDGLNHEAAKTRARAKRADWQLPLTAMLALQQQYNNNNGKNKHRRKNGATGDLKSRPLTKPSTPNVTIPDKTSLQAQAPAARPGSSSNPNPSYCTDTSTTKTEKGRGQGQGKTSTPTATPTPTSLAPAQAHDGFRHEHEERTNEVKPKPTATATATATPQLHFDQPSQRWLTQQREELSWFCQKLKSRNNAAKVSSSSGDNVRTALAKAQATFNAEARNQPASFGFGFGFEPVTLPLAHPPVTFSPAQHPYWGSFFAAQAQLKRHRPLFHHQPHLNRSVTTTSTTPTPAGGNNASNNSCVTNTPLNRNARLLVSSTVLVSLMEEAIQLIHNQKKAQKVCKSTEWRRKQRGEDYLPKSIENLYRVYALLASGVSDTFVMSEQLVMPLRTVRHYKAILLDFIVLSVVWEQL